MKISSQTNVKETAVLTTHSKQAAVLKVQETSVSENSLVKIMHAEQIANEKEAFPKEKVQKAVDALNEFMTVQNHNSRFVMHEGLERYFVQVVDSKTDEVIREVPPRKLLDAFYSMQKFLGMIVDEKI
ncbi:MAG: flagellar protein FlaG [Psychrobacillus psychrodurans]